MSESDRLLPADVVTVVGIEAWRGRSAELVVLLGALSRQTVTPKVVPSPPGSAPAADAAEVADPAFWAADVAALSDALNWSSPTVGTPDRRTAPQAVPTGAERLTLTVEEAATSLGISRASAYEAVGRGDIPAIRIGRRILVPRAALERFLASTVTHEQEPETET